MRLTLATVRDRTALQDCLIRYAQGVDQRLWPLYDSAFWPDARIEVPGYRDGASSATEFREMLAGTFDRNRLSGQHLLGNMQPVIRGDRARMVTEFLATTLEETADGEILREVTPGLYIDDYRREDGEWRIERHIIARKGSDGALLAPAAPIVAAVRTTLTTGFPGQDHHD